MTDTFDYDRRMDLSKYSIVTRAQMARLLRSTLGRTASAATWQDLADALELSSAYSDAYEAHIAYLQEKCGRYDALVAGGLAYLEVWANYAAPGEDYR